VAITATPTYAAVAPPPSHDAGTIEGGSTPGTSPVEDPVSAMRKAPFVAAVAGTVLIADQITKWWVRHTLLPGESVPIIEHYFHIVHARNPGGAFSFLADASPALRLPFFLTASALALGALIYFLRQVEPRERLLLFALSGLLGGALGNLYDRISTGFVTDFLDAHWHTHHWPAFNVADSFITIGITILVAHSLFSPGKPPGEPPTRSSD